MNSARIQYQLLLPAYSTVLIKNETQLCVPIHGIFLTLLCIKQHINYQYNLLSCISGVDNMSLKYRFNVVYEMLSVIFSSRIRIKIFLNEITAIPSIVNIFINANWWEREIWDLFGLYFKNHPDLRRILTDYGFEGHPMRKDFPLSGFIELRYDLNKKQIISEKLELAQNFRFYNYETPW